MWLLPAHPLPMVLEEDGYYEPFRYLQWCSVPEVLCSIGAVAVVVNVAALAVMEAQIWKLKRLLGHK